MKLCECGCGGEVRSSNPKATYVADHRERDRSRAQYACARCGAPKEPRKGSRYCLTCAPIAKAETKAAHYAKTQAAKRAARPPAEVFPDGYRRCALCKEVLPEAQFPPRRGKPSSYCTPCYAAYVHERKMARDFGITADDYARMLEAQDGRCAICLSKPRSRRLAVDHNHSTGEIRGLLCTRCNHKVLGAAKEDPAILRRAARYLENPPTRGTTPAELGDFTGLQVEKWIDELREAKTAEGAELGVLILADDDVPPSDWICVMDVDDYAHLMKEAGR